jgi:Protein of unknown function (DUF2442)
MLNKVIEAKIVAPYTLRITFSDGASGVHKFDELLIGPAPILEPFKEPSYFERVFLEYGALTWPNSYDMCPDWLRMEMEKAGELHRPAAE